MPEGTNGIFANQRSGGTEAAEKMGRKSSAPIEIKRARSRDAIDCERERILRSSARPSPLWRAQRKVAGRVPMTKVERLTFWGTARVSAGRKEDGKLRESCVRHGEGGGRRAGENVRWARRSEREWQAAGRDVGSPARGREGGPGSLL